MASPSPIRTVGVIGTGVIGSSWTALFLAKGLRVIVSDPAPGAEERLSSYLKHAWPALTKVGLSPGASLDNYKFVADISEYLDQVDFVQENGPERLDFKRSLFAQLDAKTPDNVILASSSSGLPSSQFIVDCKMNPARIVIGHPFNPPHLVPLVEVVPHPGTNVASAAMEFYRSLNKDPVLVRQETPGFIANRLQAAVCAEAYSLVTRGIITPQDLDRTMTSGVGLRWALTGPFMSNALGGGGSFRHFVDHIGSAMESWEEDMRRHRFDWSKENIDALDGTVSSWVDTVDLNKVVEARDDRLIGLTKDESGSS